MKKGFLLISVLIVVSIPKVKSQQTDTILDLRDGQKYKIVKIDQKWWMMENLNASTFLNGDVIPNISDNSLWLELGETSHSSARCYYNNDSITYGEWGTLYNGWTIQDERGLCPVGWHVPSDTEWSDLINFLGGSEEAMGKIMDTRFWSDAVVSPSNSSGFSVIPSGRRFYDGTFMDMGDGAFFRSSTKETSLKLWSYILWYLEDYVLRTSWHKGNGFSTRCISDLNNISNLIVVDSNFQIVQDLDFGFESMKHEIFIVNQSTSEVTISDIRSSNSAFKLNKTTATINPADSIHLVVSFNPIKGGKFIDTLFIEINNSKEYIQEVYLDAIYPTSNFEVQKNTCLTDIVNINFNGIVSDISNANFNWDFDGAIITSGSGAGPYEVQWNSAGVKEVGLYVNDSGIITDTTVQEIFVNPNPIAPTFIVDKDILCYSDTLLVTYTGSGTSNTTYNWDFGDGNIISGTGQGAYQINWSSAGLKNISLDVEENGCNSTAFSQNVKVYQPNPSFSLDDVVCENQNTNIAFNGTASDSATFNWDFDGANIVSENNETYLVNWDNLGVKEVSLIINDNGCLSSQTIQSIEHNSIPTPTFSAPVKVCYNGIANIEYLGTATSSASYNWNFGNGSILSGSGGGPYEISWSNSGIKTISLDVTENGCSSDTSVSLSVNQQTQPISICMVSVDSLNHNMIVWEQPIDNAFDSILVYKETSQSDVYKKIGSHFSGNKTVFIDENSNPAQNSSRYKIAVIDTCGYETAQSDYHKTMHLTINSGINGAWNLIWDGYEGFSYSTYNIYRGTSDGNMLKIAEQASNTFTYTDLTPPVGTVYYQIEVENPNSCNISNLKSFNNYYGSTRSNIVNSSQVNSLNDFSLEGIEIYPNPTNDKIYIKTITSDDYDMEILSLDGKLMINYQNIQNNSEFDISTLRPGMYLIKLTNDKKSMNMKLIKR